MLQQDYLMRMIMRFVEAFTNVMARHGEERRDRAGHDLSIEQLEDVIGDAAEMDPSVLLSLEPASMASMIWMGSGSESTAEYMVHALMMSAQLYDEDGLADTAALRREQARALADAFGFEYSPERLAQLMDPQSTKDQLEAEEFARQYGISSGQVDE